MGKRMKYYLDYYKALCDNNLSKEEAKKEQENLLVQIQFFQHERLIHLIVTVLFALLFVITLLTNLFVNQLLLVALELLFLVLLIPYIHHYYILENGVQKLYQCYDSLKEKE